MSPTMCMVNPSFTVGSLARWSASTAGYHPVSKPISRRADRSRPSVGAGTSRRITRCGWPVLGRCTGRLRGQGVPAVPLRGPPAANSSAGTTSATPTATPPAPAMAEKAALFRAAHRELGLLDVTDEEANLTDGKLRTRVVGYVREEVWAPRFVAPELDATNRRLDEVRGDATIWRARADAPKYDTRGCRAAARGGGWCRARGGRARR